MDLFVDLIHMEARFWFFSQASHFFRFFILLYYYFTITGLMSAFLVGASLFWAGDLWILLGYRVYSLEAVT